MSIKIITDASSNLFPEILKNKNLDIKILPMQLELKDKHYLCYDSQIDASKLSSEFYQEMMQGAKPKTSLVSPGLMEDVISEEVKKGNKVIYVSLAKHISGNYQAANLVAEEINSEYGDEYVHVIDSLTASFGEAMVAIYAYELTKQNLDFKEICQKTEEYVLSVRSEFTVNSIKYLANTGRVSSFAAALASVLAIKPLLYGSPQGKIEVTSKVHGRMGALKTLANQVIENIKDQKGKVYIAHADSLKDAEFVASKLKEAGIDDIEIYYYDLVTGAHVGPGTIACFYEGVNREFNKASIIKNVLSKIKK